jgi:uncharacterized membrane protein YukC
MEFIPKLVDPSNFNKINKINKINLNLPKKKFDINKILLIGFILFTIFFLYNCKYGIFKYTPDNLYTITP